MPHKDGPTGSGNVDRPEEIQTLLDKTRCVFCPNSIGDEPYHLLDEFILVLGLMLMEDTPPPIVMMHRGQIKTFYLMHTRCFENLKLTMGGSE